MIFFFFFAHLHYLSFLQEISAIQIKKKKHESGANRMGQPVKAPAADNLRTQAVEGVRMYEHIHTYTHPKMKYICIKSGN